jgi:hypothetical protein
MAIIVIRMIPALVNLKSSAQSARKELKDEPGSNIRMLTRYCNITGISKLASHKGFPALDHNFVIQPPKSNQSV